MQTITLDIDKYTSREDVVQFLSKEEIHRGDAINIETTIYNKNALDLEGVFLIVILAIAYIMHQKTNKPYGQQVLDDLFDPLHNRETLEKLIEEEYGIDINIESKLLKEPDEETKYWHDLSAKGLEKAYGENEPEYTMNDVKEPNPTYGKWKKE